MDADTVHATRKYECGDCRGTWELNEGWRRKDEGRSCSFARGKRRVDAGGEVITSHWILLSTLPIWPPFQAPSSSGCSAPQGHPPLVTHPSTPYHGILSPETERKEKKKEKEIREIKTCTVASYTVVHCSFVKRGVSACVCAHCMRMCVHDFVQ